MRVLSGGAGLASIGVPRCVSVTFLGTRLVQVVPFVAENSKSLSMSARSPDLEGPSVSRFGNFSTRFGASVHRFSVLTDNSILVFRVSNGGGLV